MPLSKEQKAKVELELEFLAKERKRLETEEIGEEVRGDIAERAEETIKDTPRALVEDVPIALAQGATFDHADEIYGKLQQFKAQTKDPRELEDIYIEARDAVREKTETARTKSPFLTFLAESVGEQATATGVMGPALKVMRKGGKILRGILPTPGAGTTRETMIRSGLQGEGASGEKGEIQSKADNVVAAGISSVTGGATNLLGKGAKGMFSDPNRLRSKAIGFPKRSYLKEGSEYFDPMKITEEVNKQRFFSPDPVEFNVNTLNFKPSRKGKPLSTDFTQEDLRVRAEDAISKIRNKVMQSLSQSKSARNTYTSQHLLPEIQSQKMASLKDSVDPNKLGALWDKEIELFKDNIDNVVTQPGMQPIVSGSDISLLYELKGNYQKAASQAYKRVEDPANADVAEIRESIARSLRRFIEQEASDVADIQKLNRVSAQYHKVQKSLMEAVAAKDSPSAQPRSLMEKLTTGMLEKAGTTPAGRLRRADIGDSFSSTLSKVPSGQTMISRDVNRLMYGNDSSVGLKFMELGIDAALGGGKPVAEQVIRMKLPRDSQSFIEKANLVKMKVAQQMPEQFDYVQDVLDNNPEEVPRLLPLLIKALPHFFAPDDYDRIDGKVTTPAGRFKAEKRIDELDVPNHKKMEMKDRLFKTGEFDDN